MFTDTGDRNRQVLLALCVMDDLQRWLVAGQRSGSRPIANLQVGDADLQLRIGHIEVWNSEDYEISELTFEYCKNEYINVVRGWADSCTDFTDGEDAEEDE
jgi:hypothetical protein